MNNIRSFVVVPSLPAPLEKLRELSQNLWWAWHPAAADLYRRLDLDLWERVGHNPVALLSLISQRRLEQAARDSAYMAQYSRVIDAFQMYVRSPGWCQETQPDAAGGTIAYFSAEFGLHECLPIYSGGLGVLAGDHLKSASDLGLPLVGVGLIYRHGYFTQQITDDGWQRDVFPTYDFHQWPGALIRGDDGAALHVRVPIGRETLIAQVFRVDVGRVQLYLLDADLPENPPEFRAVTSRLYDSDHDVRIRQEILLGIGGYRALERMGLEPTVCHMNEGHSAFLALERIRQFMARHRLNFQEAREAVFSSGVFTTHTPVPAGIDMFAPKLVEHYLSGIADEMGVSMDDILALGREDPARQEQPFCMAILALRNAYHVNGVSELHGDVSRGMWRSCWPNLPREEVPITHVTNGIHTRTWLGRRMSELLDHYLGPGWETEPDNPEVWQRVDDIPDAELWRAKERLRERLVATVRRRMREQLRRRGAPPSDIEAADGLLDPHALTIGFARRFAPYKRAALLFRNPARLAAIINHAERPVQFIFAGKAHPNDSAGKELLKQIFTHCQRPELHKRVLFLENYDMNLARELVHGVDVWMNNPLRLHEASGTSGMKAVANGALHMSCLDGWWPEAYDGKNGWAIGEGHLYDDPAYQDYVDSESIYNLLEREVSPLYYDRNEDNVPRAWIARIKHSLRTICPVYNTHRMVREYFNKMYLPSICRARKMGENDFSPVRSLTTWKHHLSEAWPQVRIESVDAKVGPEMRVGDSFPVWARVHLGELRPDEVAVEVYHGTIAPSGDIGEGRKVRMRYARHESNGAHVFEADVPCEASGRRGYAVRVVPRSDEFAMRHEDGWIVWG